MRDLNGTQCVRQVPEIIVRARQLWVPSFSTARSAPVLVELTANLGHFDARHFLTVGRFSSNPMQPNNQTGGLLSISLRNSPWRQAVFSSIRSLPCSLARSSDIRFEVRLPW